MYSLVALGFVLIYKASGVFNFAQGAMVFFAALTTVGFISMGAPFWLAVALALVAMVALAFFTERVVLRPLVNQPQITLFMATIGLSFFIEGIAQLTWGAQVHALDLGIADEPIEWLMDKTGMNISKFDLVASGIAAALVAVLAVFFSKTRTGRALRAVADDHQAALAVGISLRKIWVIVWIVAGFVALVTGLLWGARNGVQFALTFLALKALPVLILGGFESIAGAIVGGLIVGASEKLAEVYIGPHVGGGIESWFPYVLALAFLLVRARGSVRRAAHRPGLTTAMLYRETGQFKTTYAADQQLFPIRQDRIGMAILLAVAFVGVPLVSVVPAAAAAIDLNYWFNGMLIPFLIFSLAALGLNILTGYAGQLSLGTAAFMAVGAFAAYNFELRVPGIPMLASFILAGVVAALVGIVFGLPSLRIKGFYLAGRDPRRAVLRRMGADQVRLVFQLQLIGSDHRAEARRLRLRGRHSGEALSAGARDRERYGTCRQEHGAKLHWPGLDGGARHGRRGRGRRHPDDEDQAPRLCNQFLLLWSGRRASTRSRTWARSSRRDSSSIFPSGSSS